MTYFNIRDSRLIESDMCKLHGIGELSAAEAQFVLFIYPALSALDYTKLSAEIWDNQGN